MYKRIKLLVSLLFIIGFGANSIAQTATVYILRKSVVGAMIKFPVAVNDMQVGKLGPKKYIECKVPAGNVSVSCVSEKVNKLDFVADSGQKYYVEIVPAMGMFAARASLVHLRSDEGAEQVEKLKMDAVADLTNGSINPNSAAPTQGNFLEQLASSQQQYADTKHIMVDIVAKQDKLLLSGKDRQELATINEMLSDVNNSLYAVSNDKGSESEKMQRLAKIDKALFIIDNRIRSKYGAFLAKVGNEQIAQTVPSSNNGGASNQKTDVAAAPEKPVVKSDVDMNIPVSVTKAENTFALIIANEDYMFVDDVKFAINDGEIFSEYCIKTLGIPERQVWLYRNASAGVIAGGVDKLLQAMNIFDKPKVIVYYCGHGIPDEKTGDAYIVPTDGKGTNVATCYSLNKLYKTLASAKAASVTYFMDACFTGANRDGSMLVAARGVAREAKKEVITGDTVVFSAASGDETAMSFTEKSHGLFTYYLLKKLQETKGNVSYGELADYISTNVKREAFLTNEKPQNPVVATSESAAAKWKNIRIK